MNPDEHHKTFIEQREFLTSNPADVSAISVRLYMDWNDKHEFSRGTLYISDGGDLVQFDFSVESGEEFRHSEEMLTTLIDVLTTTRNRLQDARSLFVQSEARHK
jgi:hypothetical protein